MNIRDLGLYFHTVRHLKPVQVVNRISRSFGRVRADHRPAPSLRNGLSAGLQRPFLARPASIGAADRYRFLNRERVLTLPEGWQDHGASRLWGYHLHYFDGLQDPITPQRRKEQLVSAWIRHNAPGTAPGWEPYPLSLRIVNWIKWMIRQNVYPDAVLQSLAVQTRYLERTLEYHLLGNHLLANAKALVFAGLAFQGSEAARWYRLGMGILREQLPIQFLQDGGHFELSPVYHGILTEDLLDLIRVHDLACVERPQLVEATASRALRWMDVMTRPDELPPLFNDGAYGMAPTRTELDVYAEDLGVDRTVGVTSGVTFLRESGYLRFESERYSLFWDVGPVGPDYLPGHAHCDMLSFELWALGRPIVVDTGTSTYGAGWRRTLERGTAAHNTVQVGLREQSEIWASFRMARRARMESVEVDPHSAEAICHAFPPAWVRHRRRIDFGGDALTITDQICGQETGERTVARLHLHPDETPELIGREIVRTRGVNFRFMGASSVRLVDYQYAPEFNRLRSAKAVEADFSAELTTICELRAEGAP